MKARILTYRDIMEISRLDKENRARRYSRHVKLQNWVARHGYRFWNKVFNLF